MPDNAPHNALRAYCAREAAAGRAIAGITRHDLVNARVTLNGKPAAIGGRLNDYATVTALDCSVSGEWSWDAAARIVARDGAFTR